jgi:hypothetical protein
MYKYRKFYYLIITLFIASCGLLKPNVHDFYYDPGLEKLHRARINNKPEVIKYDSIIDAVNSANSEIPADFYKYPLAVQTYNYEEFLNLNSTKFDSARDNHRYRQLFKKFERKIARKLKQFPSGIQFMREKQYQQINSERYPYVLKFIKIVDDAENVIIYSNGKAGARITIFQYYILDRRNNKLLVPNLSLNEISKPK